MNPPFMYDYANAAISQRRPGTVHTQGTELFEYFRRYLFQKILSVYKWTMPDTWANNYFLYVLYFWGYIAIINTDKYGVIPQGCGLQGYNVFYQPRKVLIANPLLKGLLNPVIGEDCTLIQLQPDYGGVMDLVNQYAEQLALASEAVSVNLVNSKVSFGFAAPSKGAAASFKAMYDEIAAGNPAVVFDRSLLNDDGSPAWSTFSQNIRESYIVSDLLEDMVKIEERFNTIIGIPNANVTKKARLNLDEVNANNVDTECRAMLWLEQLQKGCRQAREMFGIKLDVDWRIKPEEVMSDDQQADDQGTV